MTPAEEPTAATAGGVTLPLSGCSFELVDGDDPEPRLPADVATLAAAGWAR
jgi:hypothetical protein